MLCPNAWLINFTNPAGMDTEAVLRYMNNLSKLEMLPCPYHRYYYMTDAMILEVLEEAQGEGTRKQVVETLRGKSVRTLQRSRVRS